MKRVLIGFLAISLAANLVFIQRKLMRDNLAEESGKLRYYKKISHQEGHHYFVKQIKANYPETNLSNKYFIIYVWDSLLYDFTYRDQMKALDSMASNFGKYKLQYIFATEMEEGASKGFLKRNGDAYSHVKMLYGMDDFISGLHNNKDIELAKPKVISATTKRTGVDDIPHAFKKKNLYLIMDAEGKVLFTNKNMYRILKDTAFLNKLNGLLPGKNLEILN